MQFFLIITAIAIAVISAEYGICWLIDNMFDFEYDPTEKEKEDQYYMTTCNQQMFILTDYTDCYYDPE